MEVGVEQLLAEHYATHGIAHFVETGRVQANAHQVGDDRNLYGL
jgi:hypothetical protein